MYKDYTRRNGGYDWSAGMSNRAVEAYENGAMPKSRWTKEKMLSAMIENIGDVIARENLEKLKNGLASHSVEWLRDNLLSYDSWHHTSSAYNKTTFYSIKAFELDEYLEILNREEVKKEKEKPVFRMVVASYSVSIKGRRGWTYEDVVRLGISDHKWFFPIDGYMYYNSKKQVGGYHYSARPATRKELVTEWRKLHGGSIKGFKAFMDKYGL